MTAAASAGIRPLDRRFAAVVALMRSTQHEGEKANACATAERLAADAGMTLNEAIATTAAPSPVVNIFAGFDDWMEEREPGHKAKCAAERADRIRAWKVRRAALLAKYGTLDAVGAPCPREKLILAAVAPWRTVQPDYPRWTDELDGWGHWSVSTPLPSSRVMKAISEAYPLPRSYAEAEAEHRYWVSRNQELEDVFANEDGRFLGDSALDTAVQLRADLVRDLYEHKLRVTTLTDLHARFAMYQAMDSHMEEIAAALFRDLTAMLQEECHGPITGCAGSVGKPDSDQRPSVHAGGQVCDLLRAHPDWPDRRLARAAGCSPTTVGKARRALGLEWVARSVVRGGKTYRINTGGKP